MSNQTLEAMQKSLEALREQNAALLEALAACLDTLEAMCPNVEAEAAAGRENSDSEYGADAVGSYRIARTAYDKATSES